MEKPDLEIFGEWFVLLFLNLNIYNIKISMLIALILLIETPSFSQFEHKPFTNKSIYAEIGGPGILSLNFDARFNKNSSKGFGYNFGFGQFSASGFLSNSSVITFPVGVNYLYSNNIKNNFEIGTGFTTITTNFQSNLFNNENEKLKFTNAFGYFTIGYRRQPIDNGFIFRITLNPLFDFNSIYPTYGGNSFGYKF